MGIKRLEDGSLAEPINQFLGNGEAETNITGDARFGIQRGDKTTGAKNVEVYTNGAKVGDTNALPIKMGTGSGFATEVKQDTINATITGLKGSTAPKTLEDLEATLEAILAKLVASAATEAKQDILEATLEAILAKIVASPSTEAKQDTLNTSIAGVITEVAGLKGGGGQTLTELEAILDAILAKLIASPATESKQDTLNTSVGGVTSAVNALKGSGTPVTLEDLEATLEELKTAIVLAAGSNVIGKVGLQVEGSDASTSNRVPTQPGHAAPTVTVSVTGPSQFWSNFVIPAGCINAIIWFFNEATPHNQLLDVLLRIDNAGIAGIATLNQAISTVAYGCTCVSTNADDQSGTGGSQISTFSVPILGSLPGDGTHLLRVGLVADSVAPTTGSVKIKVVFT